VRSVQPLTPPPPPVPYLSKWPQAMALGLLPQNLEATGRGLAVLADELCFAAGDRSGIPMKVHLEKLMEG
jgi:hypothetical protein